MEKDFINYEEALALKELGFDEKCIKGFFNKEELYTVVTTPVDFNNKSSLGQLISCPLYQQALRWFREKYKLKYSVDPELDTWFIELRELNGVDGNPAIIGYPDLSYNTYEEAELACLKNLIEIVKNKNNDTTRI